MLSNDLGHRPKEVKLLKAKFFFFRKLQTLDTKLSNQSSDLCSVTHAFLLYLQMIGSWLLSFPFSVQRLLKEILEHCLVLTVSVKQKGYVTLYCTISTEMSYAK